MVIEILFAGFVIIVMPMRALWRYRRGTPPARAARYIPETLLLTVILAFLLRHRGIPAGALGLKPLSLQALAELAVCLGVIIGIDWRMAGVRVRQIQSSRVVSAPKGLAADALAGHRAGASYIAVIVVGAIWEELCFRATIFAVLPHNATGILLGLVAGSALFGAHHLRSGPIGVIYSTAFGLVFALLFLATGNLWALMLAHAGGNLMTALKWAPQIERARQTAASPAPTFLG